MKKALIIQNKFVGDVLVSSLLAKNIKKIFPTIKVHFFCYDKAFGVLENNPYIDKIITFDNEEFKKINNLWKMASSLRAEKYDIIFDPYAKLQSRFIVFRSQAPIKISFNKPLFKYLYTDLIKEFDNPIYSCCTSIDDRMKLLSPFKPNFKELDFQTEIFLTETEIQITKKLMIENGVDFSKKTLMIGVLGSEPNKSLPLKYMTEIVNVIIEKCNCNILINYVPEQQNEVNILINSIIKKEKIITSILGKNIKEFACILKNCDGIIANEGGAINIAKAMKIPTFSIFSPHKYRKDWGCYENLERNKSIHMIDFYPEIYEIEKTDDLLKKFLLYYTLFTPYYIVPEINTFLYNNHFTPNISFNKKYTKNSLTAVAITYNEERNIRNFIENMSFVDELIIVDSFSTDNTCNIIKEFPYVKLHQKKFSNFPSQKNYALELVTNDWILFFDADEKMNNRLKVEILKTINSRNSKEAYYIKRKFYFQGTPMNFSGWQNDKVIRLFKNGVGKYGGNKKVHEILEIKGKTGILKTKLDHYSLDDIQSYIKKLDLYAKLKAEELFDKKIKPNFFHYKIKPLFRFIHHYIFRLGILDGNNGYIMAKLYANYVSRRYKYLDEMYN